MRDLKQENFLLPHFLMINSTTEEDATQKEEALAYNWNESNLISVFK